MNPCEFCNHDPDAHGAHMCRQCYVTLSFADDEECPGLCYSCALELIAKLGRELADLKADLTVWQEEADGWEGEANKLNIGLRDRDAQLAAKDKLIEAMIDAVAAESAKHREVAIANAADREFWARQEGMAIDLELIATKLRAMQSEGASYETLDEPGDTVGDACGLRREP